MVNLSKRFIFFMLLLFATFVEAASVEELMDDYTDKNVLSKKTIDANKGHMFLFSRDRLEKMHAKTLKDVLKLSPVLNYRENRFALPDPLSTGSIEPFKSNFMRLYIDGVEITQGWMGSGVMLYGDVNIDFADHIELYLMTTSFENSVEPAYMTIFIYSKDPKRDSGGKINLALENEGGNSQSITYGEVKEDYSYMLNYSHTKTKREKVANGTAQPLSRDYERSQLFGYIKSEDQIFHLQVMKKETDSLAGLSWDATPLTSQIDYMNVHMDYGLQLSEFWKVQFAYDWLEMDSVQADELPLIFFVPSFANPLHANYKNSTYSGELTYKNTLGNHRITTGLKGRIKHLDSFTVKGKGKVPTAFDEENVLSLFFQDQYMLTDRQLLTFGINYGRYIRNGPVEDDDLIQLRLGYIYSGDEWSYKAYLSRTMFTLDPYSRYLNELAPADPQVTSGFTHEIAYATDNNYFRLIMMAMEDEDGVVLSIGPDNTKYYFTMLNDEYTFDNDNKISLQLFYGYYEDIFQYDHMEGYGGYLSFINSYESLDFYNNIVWQKYSIDNVNSFEWTSSISWEATQNLTLTLKGENLLNKAEKSDIIRINPLLGTLSSPLSYQLTDRRILLELEYTF